jgi:hypothetical protein
MTGEYSLATEKERAGPVSNVRYENFSVCQNFDRKLNGVRASDALQGAADDFSALFPFSSVGSDKDVD